MEPSHVIEANTGRRPEQPPPKQQPNMQPHVVLQRVDVMEPSRVIEANTGRRPEQPIKPPPKQQPNMQPHVVLQRLSANQLRSSNMGHSGISQQCGRTKSSNPSSTIHKPFTRPRSHCGTAKKKKHCCKYCCKLKTNITRHLYDVHNSEPGIIDLKQKGKPEIQNVMRRLIAEGDALYNERYPDNPIVRRKSKNVSINSRDMCPSCKLLLSRSHIVSHIRKCFPASTERPGREIRVDLERCQTRRSNYKMNEQMKSDIIPFMRNGDVKRLCMEDESLILYGNKMCDRLLGENQERTIRNYLRNAARVALKTIEKDNSIVSVADIFKAVKYDSFVEAIYDICGQGQGEGMEMKYPTVPQQYGLRMRELSDCLVTSLMKQRDPDESDFRQVEVKKKIERIEGWQALYDREFYKQVASLGRKQAERRSFENKQQIPSMEDVQKLIKYVHGKTNVSFKRLETSFSTEDFINLSKCLLLKLWIFNRRRVGEVDKLCLNNWLNAKEISESSVQYKTLSPTEQNVASSYKRVLVQGKHRRTVALLIQKEDLKCYDLLISLRKKAQVSEDNKYLFAKNNSHIEGTSAMREFAKRSGARNWKLLTGTRLRKHLAACLRYLNLNDEDLRLVAEVMGHTQKTHLVHYRKHDSALHAGKASKFLTAMDEGTISKFSGKSLDEIDDRGC